MNPISDGPGLVGLNNLGTLVKNITGALKEAGKAEVISQVIDLQILVSDLIEKNRALSEANTLLQEKLDARSKMTFTGRWYYKDGDNTPCCARCWDVDGKAVFMRRDHHKRGWVCSGCTEFCEW